MVLKRAFMSDAGEASAISLFSSPRRQSFQVIDTGEASSYSLFRSPGRWSFESVTQGRYFIFIVWFSGDRALSLWKREASAQLLFRSPGRHSFWWVELYLEDGLDRGINRWHWGILHIFIVQLSWEAALWVSGVLLRRWSCKGH